MRVKPDEENVDEAYKSAFRAYPFTQIPFEIKDLLSSSHLSSVGPESPIFDRLLAALKVFVDKKGVLPLSAALPDMHSDTENYIKLQRIYKDRANEEKAEFKGYIKGTVDDVLVDAFVKNAHALRVLEGQKFGALDGNKDAVGKLCPPYFDRMRCAQKVIANAIMGATYSRDPVTHFCLSAFFNVLAASYQGQTDPKPTAQEIQTELKRIIGDAELPEKEIGDCIGELCVHLFFFSYAGQPAWDGTHADMVDRVRTPTAELPNVAAFLGGLVAQEVIKVVTKQYVPINGYCVVDLVSTFTGIVR
jgi:NEDD8-activating enzyme E1 regulatory subunit